MSISMEPHFYIAQVTKLERIYSKNNYDISMTQYQMTIQQPRLTISLTI